MIPEPITAADRKNAPFASAASLRLSAGWSRNGGFRVPGAADFAQPIGQPIPSMVSSGSARSNEMRAWR